MRGREVVAFLVIAAVLVLIVSVIQWQKGLFLGVMAVTFLAAGSPLILASRLVAKSLSRDLSARRLPSRERVLAFLAAMFITVVLAYLSYHGALLIADAASDDPVDAYSVAGTGAAVALFMLALACVSVVPVSFLIRAVVAAASGQRKNRA